MIKFILNLFLISIFFILLPPLILPLGLPSLINTYSFSRIIFLILFFVVFIRSNKKNTYFIKYNNTDIVSLAVFILFQTLSVVYTINPVIFFQRFEKLIFGIIAFYIYIYLSSKQRGLKKSVIFVFFLSYLLKALFELSIYLQIFQRLHLDIWLHPSFLNTLQANINRNRPYSDLFLEASFPLFFYYFYTYFKRKFKEIFLFIFSIMMLFLSFVSEWRGRFINAFFVLSPILIAYIRYIKISLKKILFFLLIISMLFALINIMDNYQLAINSYSIIDRFLEIQTSPSSIGNVDSTSWRFSMFKKSIDMADSNIFGVGLGNFYDNLENSFKPTLFMSSNNYKLSQEALLSGPHNIFFQFLAESGIFGLLSFLVMLFIFFVKDVGIIMLNTANIYVEDRFLIFAFWSLIVGGMFYPVIDLGFYLSFFLFRAMIQDVKK